MVLTFKEVTIWINIYSSKMGECMTSAKGTEVTAEVLLELRLPRNLLKVVIRSEKVRLE